MSQLRNIMTRASQHLSVITLTTNGHNSLIKKHRLDLKKIKLCRMHTRGIFNKKEIYGLKIKE